MPLLGPAGMPCLSPAAPLTYTAHMAVRVRQHVNPLALKYLHARARAVRIPEHLDPPSRVDVELGCADAKFSFDLAEHDPSRFVVGLDIREKVIEQNQVKAAQLGLQNVTFGYVNLNVDLDRVFGPSSVDAFHLLFPDPWFKVKHQKRRVVEPWLCEVLARQLRPGGELHIATDIYELALEAMAELEHPELAHLQFHNLAGPWSFWRGNPFPASSRREDTTLARGQRVWRIRYRIGSTVASDVASTTGSASASGSPSQRS